MSKIKTPGLLQMAKTFASELSTYVSQGMPNVSEEDYTERLATCESCPFFLEFSKRCGACGCLVEHKAKWKTSNCPKQKWKPQMLTHGKIEDSTDPRDSQ